MRDSKWLLSGLALLALFCAIGAFPASAVAEDVDKQVARMNKRAMEDYDSLEFESARKTLIDAVALLRSSGSDETPLAAKTYVNLGIIYIAGFKDRNRGVQQFVNALKISPDFKLDPALATPELEEALQAARKQVGSVRPKPPEPPPKPPESTQPQVAKPPEPPAKPPEPENEVKGLIHNPVDEVRPRSPVPIRAQLGTDTGATRLFLFFRNTGQEDFVSLPLKRQRGVEWVGVIPGEAVTGRALQYYLEARDARGRPVVGSGSSASPYIISINDTAPALGNVPEVDVEDPLYEARRRKQREEEEHRRGRLHHFFVFVMAGSGFGYEPAGNQTEVAYKLEKSPDLHYEPVKVTGGGVQPAPFHIAIEIGGLITRYFSLSLLGRFQLITGNNAETQDPNQAFTVLHEKATSAFAALLRARYRFLDGIVHPYIHLDIGGGQIRHYLDVTDAGNPNAPLVDRETADAYNAAAGDPVAQAAILKNNPQTVCPPGPDRCTDSISLGYFLVGGGAGLWIDVQKYVALILDVNLLGAIGIADGQSGMNVDVQAGIGVHF